MKNRRILSFVVLSSIVVAFTAVKTVRADDLQSKVDSLAKEIDQLKAKVNGQSAGESSPSWLTIGGDLRVRHDILRAKTVAFNEMAGNPLGLPAGATPAKTIQNNTLLTNRFGLNMKANVAEGVSFKARMVMEKAFGSSGPETFNGVYFADRTGIFDGTSGHYANGNTMYLDYAYADISNIMGQPIWFSAGRRPSTGGTPTNLRRNDEVSGVAGVMGLLTDYAFDGFTLGVAPAIEKLPGFATKLCYGRAFQPGYKDLSAQPSLHNTDMLGLVMIPYETDDTRIETQYQHAYHIMDTFPGLAVQQNLGDLDNFGAGIMHAFRGLGIGDLNLFAYGAMSKALPNDNTVMPGVGLLYNGTKENHEGFASYLGGRYDFTKTGTKLGFEYNQGSKYWQNFTPAADDVWTSKLGTRGHVYEVYAIQELMRDPVSPKGKVSFRLGYQYYSFNYTGSNNWVGGPTKISDISPTDLATTQVLVPVKNAYDIYTSFDVHF